MFIQYLRFPELTHWQRNQLFSIYARDKGSFLLDSSNSDNANGRFDIVAVKPLHIISIKEDKSSDPIQLLQQYHQHIQKYRRKD